MPINQDLSKAVDLDGVSSDRVSFADGITSAMARDNLPFMAGRKVRDIYDRGFFFFEDEEDFNPFDDPRVKNDIRLGGKVWSAGSQAELDVMIADIEQSDRDRAIVAAMDGTDGALATITANAFNPDLLIPGFGAAGGFRRALKASAAALSVSSAQEVALSKLDPNRTLNESLVSIAAITSAAAGFTTVSEAINSGRRTVAGGARGQRTAPLNEAASAPEDFGPSSVGSAQRAQRDLLEDEGIVATGTKIEDLPLNPVLRGLKSKSVHMRQAVEDLVDLGGIQKKKNLAGEATQRSVETEYRINYVEDLFNAVDIQNDAFLRYRGKSAGGPGRRAIAAQFTRLTDRVTDTGKLSLREFREQVGRAMRNGDSHTIPEVAEAAREYRKIFDRLGNDALEAGLFQRAIKREINAVSAGIAKLGDATDPAVASRLLKLQEKLKRLETHGLDSGNARSFFPRLYRVDRIQENPEKFINQVTEGLIEANPQLAVATARREAERVHKNMLSYRSGNPIDRTGAGDARSARARMLDIDDKWLAGFIEDDAEVVLRGYHKSIGIDIWMQRKFGDISMADQAKQIIDDFDAKIEKANPEEARQLGIERDRAVQDLQNLRDVVRGTFGTAEDPFAPTTKFLKAMKTFNVVTMMGGAAISSIPDLARIAMTEGIVEGYGPILKTFRSELRPLLLAMSRDELRAAGEGLDVVLGLRALQMADIGSSFGSLSRAERLGQEGANVFFHVNGLNLWNTVTKEWASVPIANRIVRDSIKWAEGTLDQKAIAKLTRANIDEQTAKVIAEEAQKWGKQENGVWFPNTGAWQNADEAIASFRAALSQDVNRTIVTPGAGDKAFWTSTELGSVIAQFKSFGQAMVNRSIVSGLQEKSVNFYQGAGLMVAMGFLVNELKDAIKRDDKERSFNENMVRAIDRSGLLGVFGDINNAIEVVSNQKLGIGPVFGDRRGPSTAGEVTGTLLGPTGSTLNKVGSVLGDVAQGDIDAGTARTAARLIPGTNLPPVETVRNQLLEALN